ncbi:MAG: hypothetical protein FWH07_01755 [Oscillospiraceae bacterium]|nr:hypothetical protein [Oscillospiraceae bacterium]
MGMVVAVISVLIAITVAIGIIIAVVNTMKEKALQRRAELGDLEAIAELSKIKEREEKSELENEIRRYLKSYYRGSHHTYIEKQITDTIYKMQAYSSDVEKQRNLWKDTKRQL